jgi:hypothetical protein
MGTTLETNEDGTLKADRDERPKTYFVLYREGTLKDGRWRSLADLFVGHTEEEVFAKALDRYPAAIEGAYKVRIIEADQGVAFVKAWAAAAEEEMA